jgi:hypothetical protein
MAACGDAGDRTHRDTKSLRAFLAPTTTTDSVNIVFQLTGLILVVPPKQAGEQTHLLLPVVSGHDALFGFGLPVQDAVLCSTWKSGLCYVNLADWKVSPIGAGGGATDPQDTGIPPEVLNVTRAAGTDYRVVGATGESLRSHVIFEAGRATGSPCSLAKWTFTPVSTGTSETAPLANVLNWTIRYPKGDPFKLVFVRKVDGLTKEVSIGTAREVRMLLAHVPPDEPLPPEEPTPDANVPSTLGHVHDFYNLLRHRSENTPPGAGNRPVPHYVEPAGRDYCEVGVTRARHVPMAKVGIKTYGCVIGSGEG